MIDFPIPDIADFDLADPTGHLSVRGLPGFLTNGELRNLDNRSL